MSEDQADSFSLETLKILIAQANTDQSSLDFVTAFSNSLNQFAESINVHYNDEIPLQFQEDDSKLRILSIGLLNLVRSYQKLYNSTFEQLCLAFGIETFNELHSFIKEMAFTLGINPTGNLSDQIIAKYHFPDDTKSNSENASQTSDMTDGSVTAIIQDDNFDKIQKQNKELRTALKNIKKKLDKTEQACKRKEEEYINLFENEKNSKDAISKENASLKIKIHSLESNVEDLEQRINALNDSTISNQSSSSDPQQYSAAIVEQFKKLQEQYQNEISDLESKAVSKDTLIAEYRKIIKGYQEKENKREANETHSDADAGFIIEEIHSPDDFFESLSEILSATSSSVVNDILDMINEPDSLQDEKIKNIIKALIKEINDLIRDKELQGDSSHKEEQAIIQRLLSAMHSQLEFIERLSNSDQERDWLIPTANKDDVRKALVSQAAKLQLFLSEYTEGFADDADMFDSLVLDEDPDTIHDNMQSFLSNFSSVRTTEGRELVALLRQSFAVCNILRRFALESRSQCLLLAADVRSLRNQLTSAQADYETRIEQQTAILQEELDAQIRQREDLEYALIDIKNMLKGQILLSPSDKSSSGIDLTITPAKVSDILDCIDRVDSAFEDIDDATYQQSLSYRLKAALQDINEKTLQLDDMRSTAQEDLQRIKEKFQEVQNEAVEQIKDMTTQLQESKITIGHYENQIAVLSDENQKLHEANQELSEQLNHIRISADSELNGRDEELEGMKKKMDKKLTMQVKDIQSEESERRKALMTKNAELRSEIREIQNQMQRKDNQIKSLKQKIEDLENSGALQREKQQTLAINDELKQESVELKTKIAKLEIDNKVLKTQVQSWEEKFMKRDQNNAAFANKIKETLQKEFDTKFIRSKQDLELEHTAFITQIFTEHLKRIMQIPNPVTNDDADAILKRLSEMISPRSATNSALQTPVKTSPLSNETIATPHSE